MDRPKRHPRVRTDVAEWVPWRIYEETADMERPTRGQHWAKVHYYSTSHPGYSWHPTFRVSVMHLRPGETV